MTISGPYEVTGLILVGGASRRMGRPKAELKLGDVTILERVRAALAPVCREIILIANHPIRHQDSDLTIVRDIIPGKGPLGGLATGLFYAHHPWALTLACDLAFIRPALLSFLIEKAMKKDPSPRVIIPRHAKGWEPLTAVYSKKCYKAARELLASDRPASLLGLKSGGVKFEEVAEEELRRYDPDLTSFININTPEDLERARNQIKTE